MSGRTTLGAHTPHPSKNPRAYWPEKLDSWPWSSVLKSCTSATPSNMRKWTIVDPEYDQPSKTSLFNPIWGLGSRNGL